MRNPTRIAPVLLSAVLLVSLTACGQQTQSAGQSAGQGQTAEAASLAESSAASAQVQADGLVGTAAGQIQGTIENGIYRYLGVPYARAAAERFVPAEAVEPWEGVLQADSFGPMSPQAGIIAGSEEMDQTGTDNNCQNLNIWTPGIGDGARRPVMVWLHGGGFSSGTANEEGYDGEALSRSGDVVEIPEGVRHWHGAAPDSWFSQIVIYDSHYTSPDGAAEELVEDAYYDSLETEEYAGHVPSPDSGLMFPRAAEAVDLDTFNGPIYLSSLLEGDNVADAPGLRQHPKMSW